MQLIKKSSACIFEEVGKLDSMFTDWRLRSTQSENIGMLAREYIGFITLIYDKK